MTSPATAELGERLGITLRDSKPLQQAFIHASYANEHPSRVAGNNERLEFLGDAVLGLLTSRLLYARLPDADEGTLTAYRAALVNQSTLAAVARELSLDRYLRLGRGEVEAGGARRPSLLAAVFEALVGALFLAEGLETTERAIAPLLAARLDPGPSAAVLKSAKSRLQEWSQRERSLRPAYRLLSSRGPAHAQSFTVAVVIGSEQLATGEGSSRRRAEEEAARAALERLARVP